MGKRRARGVKSSGVKEKEKEKAVSDLKKGRRNKQSRAKIKTRRRGKRVNERGI